MVENQEPEPGTEEIETTVYPWYIREIKKLSLGNRLRSLFLFGLGIFVIYLLQLWSGWYFLLGLIPAPAWYFWALRQIDRESYTLIEVKLKGDTINGKPISDTQTNIYQIPPDIWKEITIKGNPYTLGHRLYVCEYFHEDENGNKIIHFSEDPRLSNLTFFAKVKLWIDLKTRLPKIEQELALYKYANDQESTRKAVDMLEKIWVIEKAVEKGLPLRRTIPQEEKNV